MGEIFADLEKLNFSINEAKVYLTLLSLGPSLAGAIAKESQLDRSSTYNALKLLIERGIVSTVFENKRSIYVSADPKKIIDYYKEKEEIAANIIPSLQERFKSTKEKKNVILFRGYKGLKTVFQDMLDSVGKNKEHCVIGSEGTFSEKMPYYSPIFIKQKQQRKIKTRIIVREGRPVTQQKYTEYRNVPSDVVSPATINIYSGKVAIIIWDESPEAILIENVQVSKTLQNYFDFIWRSAKKTSY